MANLILELEEYPDIEFVLRISPVKGADYWALIELELPWSRDGFTALAAALEPFVVTWPLPEPMADTDPNLLLAIRHQWALGVRQVPLPLALRRSAGTPSSRTSQSPSSEPSSPTK